VTRGQARARARRALRASPAAEARYVSDLHRIVRGVHEGVEKEALSHWAHRVDDRSDAPLKRVIRALTPHIEKHVGEAFDRMSKTVRKKNFEGNATLGITVSSIGAVDILSEARARNIALIRYATLDYADDVKEILSDPENFGLRVEELTKLLTERAGVNDSRAELIARDQTTKLTGELTRARQQEAGVSFFIWSTSNDERVRPSHAELDGETFSWADLPTVDDEEAYPGLPILCRCVAAPVVDDDS
jgi:SPP1 gp7 family putative phage head morphogenesis protein